MSTFYGDVPKLAKGSASKADRPGNRRGGSSRARETRAFRFGHLRYAPVAHLEEATGLSPVKGGFKSLREYIPLYQNGIWIRLRTGGLRVQIPPRVFSVCGAMEDALCSGHSPRGCGFDSRHTDFKEDCRNGRRGRFKPGFLRVRIPCPSFTTSRKGGISHAMH